MLGREGNAWPTVVKPNLQTAMRLSPSRRAHKLVVLEPTLAKAAPQTLLGSYLPHPCLTAATVRPTTAPMIRSPTTDMNRFSVLHQVAFSYRSSSTFSI